jgi:hypothetical protein
MCVVLPYEEIHAFLHGSSFPEVTQGSYIRESAPAQSSLFGFEVFGSRWWVFDFEVDGILDFWKGERALLREKTREHWKYPDEYNDATFPPFWDALEYSGLEETNAIYFHKAGTNPFLSSESLRKRASVAFEIPSQPT